MKYERKTITAKAADEQPDQEGVVRFIASTNQPDRHGDTIDQAGWEFPEHINHLWKHDKVPSIPALGKIVRRTVEDHRLILDTLFDLEDEFAKEIYRKHKAGFLKPVSVGFMPKEGEPNDHGGLHFTKQELLELSTVHVGANPGAMQVEQEMDEAVAFAKALKAVESEAKDGRVLSEENYSDVKDARDRLDRVLEREERAPEDDEDDKDLGRPDGATERKDSGASAEAEKETSDAVVTLSGTPADDEDEDDNSAVLTLG
ncbi:MAG: HK97 family phage prohead protease [Bradymonadaceae bacterium]